MPIFIVRAVRVLSDSEGLQILRTNATAQIFFIVLFFQKTLPQNSLFFSMKFLTPYLGAARVLTKLANLALKYDCSILCSFPDMTFFL